MERPFEFLKRTKYQVSQLKAKTKTLKEKFDLTRWILIGLKLSKRSSKYSYVESLMWSEISSTANGKYTCQTTNLQNIHTNDSITIQAIRKDKFMKFLFIFSLVIIN